MIANPPPADDAPVQYRPARPQRLSRYAEAALDNAVNAIISLEAQHDNKTAETFARAIDRCAQ